MDETFKYREEIKKKYIFPQNPLSLKQLRLIHHIYYIPTQKTRKKEYKTIFLKYAEWG